MEMVPVTKDSVDTYVQVGTRSYKEHYLHLWKDSNPLPYLERNLSPAVVHKELLDPNQKHFVITANGQPAGIAKIVRNAAMGDYYAEEALLLEKIYLLKAYSGKGLGRKCLDYLVALARTLEKKLLWLDTMQNGRALSFYLDYGFEILGEKDLALPDVLEDQKAMYILGYSLED